MLYFKKTYFFDDSERNNLETGLRNHSLKRTQLLDFVFETSNTGSDKFLYGNIGKKDLKFTRIKTSFEAMLPKIIVSFPREPEVNYYKYRLSILSIFILFIISVLLFASFISIILGSGNSETLTPSLLLFTIYSLLILLELNITKNRILKSGK